MDMMMMIMSAQNQLAVLTGHIKMKEVAIDNRLSIVKLLLTTDCQ